MFGLILQLLSIVFLHDFNPSFTPQLEEDSPVLELAYQLRYALDNL